MAVVTKDAGGVLEIVLARPKRANALTFDMVKDLFAAFRDASGREDVRCVLVYGEGRHFCAGADIGWMRDSAERPAEINVEEAEALAEALRTAWSMPQPVVVAAHGACHGGGAGLCCVADVCIADSAARARFGEVRLGLEPSTISPYVVRAIGARQARRLFQTAEEVGADEALRIGLFHKVVAEGSALAAARKVCSLCVRNGPQAMASAKRLVGIVDGRPVDAELSRLTARRLAGIRISAEGREGVRAFLEKREPLWTGTETSG